MKKSSLDRMDANSLRLTFNSFFFPRVVLPTTLNLELVNYRQWAKKIGFTVDDIHVDVVVVRECLVVFRFLGGCCLVGLFMTHRDNTNIHLYFMRMKEELKKRIILG